MSIFSKVKNRCKISYEIFTKVVENPYVMTRRTKYLFILSHMRSRSSALAHVLGSNSGIFGYSELHRTYLNRVDFLRMKINLLQDCAKDPQRLYLLDKVLHNKYRISSDLLKKIEPKMIFLLREPKGTIASLTKLRNLYGGDNDPKNALNYYCSRLMELEKYVEVVGGNYFFVESDDFLSNTDEILNDLSEWLNLDTPLDKNYSLFENTGKRWFGDTSDNIKSGVIKKTQHHSDIHIPLEVLQEGQSAYEKCKKRLLIDSTVQT